MVIYPNSIRIFRSPDVLAESEVDATGAEA
jgi:hypothetical protein